MEHVVELESVASGYDGVVVLRDVDLEIEPGGFVGIIGPSGAGKTTLLRTIMGTADVYHGRVTIGGRQVRRGRPPVDVGYVPQLEAIDWDFPLTVEQVVALGLYRLHPLLPWYPRAQRRAVAEVLERLEIGHLAKRHIKELSGGQQRRAFLARALVGRPRLLVLDEPTSGVDLRTRDEVLHLLVQLNAQGLTILLSTHEVNAIAAHLPWVVCVNQTVIAQGPPEEVFTPAVLAQTYGGDMRVIRQGDLVLVADRPHFLDELPPRRRATPEAAGAQTPGPPGAGDAG